ncbi:uncharacterized protein At1g76070 [Elaeis guineensis]|uniref:Uncharacterized protein At1g76070 n=1 Tax=Elaeis guineensis var. tenera TaxID=51953 RepID=A0A6I9SD95_ELAGV|nr:uncharacterized protein At1g76070 [Elaeis guineensis]
MEKPSRAKATKIFSFLPKPTSFSISHRPLSPGREKSSKPKAFHNKAKAFHNNKAFSGPIISIVPVEARRKEKNGGNFDAQEPTSPKVSCIGRVKQRKLVCRSKRHSLPQQEWKPPTLIIRKMFRRKLRPSRRRDAAESSEGRPAVAAAGRAPSLGQMKRFTSGRETLLNFDWRKAERRQEAATGDREESYSDEESDEEDYYSAPILMGGGVVAVEPRKEVNLWKRRTLAPPVPLQLN